MTSILSLSDTKARLPMHSAIADPRPHVTASADRRTRRVLSAERPIRPARRARADAAVINQWLFEQTDRHPRSQPTPRP